MNPSDEKIALIITRAKLMALPKRFTFCRDRFGTRIYEGHILGCWHDGNSIDHSRFAGASFQMFFACFSERRNYFAGISPEAHWVCTPLAKFWGKSFVAGNIFDDVVDYRSYLSRSLCQ